MAYFRRTVNRLKYLVAGILCNNITGKILELLFKNKIPTFRFGYFQFDCTNKNILPKTKATIFWGLYETGELRLINKYLRKDLDVIELGGSLGVTSCHIKKLINTNKKLITVEANPFLIETIKRNLNSCSASTNFHVLNFAIGKKELNMIDFNISNDNLFSKTSFLKSDKSIAATVRTLSSIISDFSFNEYVLVADIEGAELLIFLSDEYSLKNCKQIIIELHDAEYEGRKYGTDEVKNYIRNHFGFVYRANYGAVFVFDKF